MIQHCQRWRSRRATWRPRGELFNPGCHEVAVIDADADAKRFVVDHHYSASYPAARFRVGLFRASSSARLALAGVAVFSVPMNAASFPKFCGQPVEAGVELGRFVLLDEVEANGETWFLAQAFALLTASRPEFRAVLSYADPVARTDEAGTRVTPGHVGTIYQAFNGRYLGRSEPRTLLLTRAGRTLSPRALSKLRNDERGAAHVYAMLVAAGAPARQPLESGPAYVRRALVDGPFRRFAHPGNHRYAWPLGGRSQRHTALSRFAPAQPYPKPVPALPFA